jgi:hypothetical protein
MCRAEGAQGGSGRRARAASCSPVPRPCRAAPDAHGVTLPMASWVKNLKTTTVLREQAGVHHGGAGRCVSSGCLCCSPSRLVPSLGLFRVALRAWTPGTRRVMAPGARHGPCGEPRRELHHDEVTRRGWVIRDACAWPPCFAARRGAVTAHD